MTKLRTIETRLAIFTLAASAVFAPLETLATWQMFGAAGLVHPGFFGSIAGIVLLLAGAIRSLRARPRRAPALMCASHAWWAGTGWHAAGLRYTILSEGNPFFYGSLELWVVVAGVAVAVAALALSLFLTYKAELELDPDGAPMRR